MTPGPINVPTEAVLTMTLLTFTFNWPVGAIDSVLVLSTNALATGAATDAITAVSTPILLNRDQQLEVRIWHDREDLFWFIGRSFSEGMNGWFMVDSEGALRWVCFGFRNS